MTNFLQYFNSKKFYECLEKKKSDGLLEEENWSNFEESELFLQSLVLWYGDNHQKELGIESLRINKDWEIQYLEEYCLFFQEDDSDGGKRRLREYYLSDYHKEIWKRLLTHDTPQCWITIGLTEHKVLIITDFSFQEYYLSEIGDEVPGLVIISFKDFSDSYRKIQGIQIQMKQVVAFLEGKDTDLPINPSLPSSFIPIDIDDHNKDHIIRSQQSPALQWQLFNIFWTLSYLSNKYKDYGFLSFEYNPQWEQITITTINQLEKELSTHYDEDDQIMYYRPTDAPESEVLKSLYHMNEPHCFVKYKNSTYKGFVALTSTTSELLHFLQDFPDSMIISFSTLDKTKHKDTEYTSRYVQLTLADLYSIPQVDQSIDSGSRVNELSAKFDDRAWKIHYSSTADKSSVQNFQGHINRKAKAYLLVRGPEHNMIRVPDRISLVDIIAQANKHGISLDYNPTSIKEYDLLLQEKKLRKLKGNIRKILTNSADLLLETDLWDKITYKASQLDTSIEKIIVSDLTFANSLSIQVAVSLFELLLSEKSTNIQYQELVEDLVERKLDQLDMSRESMFTGYSDQEIKSLLEKLIL